MKTYISFLIAAFVFTNSFAQLNDERKTSYIAKTPIALLGIYHLDNPNQDQFNIKSDSIFSAKRQKELEALVKKLATFKPAILPWNLIKATALLINPIRNT